MNDSRGAKLGVLAYARHAGVSGPRVSKLVKDGVLPRDAEGLIDVAQADRILAERRAIAPEMLMRSNAARKRVTAAAPVPVVPDEDHGDEDEDEDEDDDGARIDPVFADAMLAQQSQACLDRDYGQPGLTSIQRTLEEAELRTARAQNDILARTAAQLREVVGGDVAKDARHRAILGELYGRLRALLDAERVALEHSFEFVARNPGATRQ